MKEIFIDIEGHSGRLVDEPGIIAGICKDLNAEGVNIRAISCQVAKAGVSESKGNTEAVPSVAIAVEDEDAVNAHYVLKGMPSLSSLTSLLPRGKTFDQCTVYRFLLCRPNASLLVTPSIAIHP